MVMDLGTFSNLDFRIAGNYSDIDFLIGMLYKRLSIKKEKER